MKGYKVFNGDMTCRGFQYEVGKTYKHNGPIELCKSGFHFCTRAIDCFNYYCFDPDNVVCEVEAIGSVLTGETKNVTDAILVCRRLSWTEVLSLCNTGNGNTGNQNAGDWNAGSRNAGNQNTGDRNTGDWNTGNRNAGDWNAGDHNTGDGNAGDQNTGDGNAGDWNTGDRNTGRLNAGDRNTGDRNTGDRNTGDRNTGDHNNGDRNTGDHNNGDRHSGFFCTGEAKMMVFNKPTDMTYREVRDALPAISLSLTLWVKSEDMTEDEKEAHPEHVTTGGYLKTIPYKEAWGKWWMDASSEERSKIKQLPNFDSDIFYKITGIRV